MSVVVREARAGDGPSIHAIIMALAEHQQEAHLVTATAHELEAALCAPHDERGCLLAELDGQVVGLAYWYSIFTTYKAQTKLYMEDLCVLPQAPGTGAGIAMLKALANICVERGYPRFEWLAMDYNDVGIEFYTRLGGKVKQGAQTWQMWELEIKALAEAV